MTEEYIIRRKRLDHERYLRNRDERKAYQREYYRTHRETVKAKVKECKERRWQREKERMFLGILSNDSAV